MATIALNGSSLNPAGHYVYIIFRLDGRPCYVGKGTGDRYRDHASYTHNARLRRIYKKAGGDLPVAIIRDGLEEQQALEYEMAFIAAIGRADKGDGPLVNLTDGGDGLIGWIPSAETRERIRAGNTGKKLSEAARAKMSAAGRGRPKSQAHKDAIRAALKGKPKSAEHKAKMVIVGQELAMQRAEAVRRWHARMTPEQKAMRAEKIRQGMRAAA